MQKSNLLTASANGSKIFYDKVGRIYFYSDQEPDLIYSKISYHQEHVPFLESFFFNQKATVRVTNGVSNTFLVVTWLNSLKFATYQMVDDLFSALRENKYEKLWSLPFRFEDNFLLHNFIDHSLLDFIRDDRGLAWLKSYVPESVLLDWMMKKNKLGHLPLESAIIHKRSDAIIADYLEFTFKLLTKEKSDKKYIESLIAKYPSKLSIFLENGKIRKYLSQDTVYNRLMFAALFKNNSRLLDYLTGEEFRYFDFLLHNFIKKHAQLISHSFLHFVQADRVLAWLKSYVPESVLLDGMMQKNKLGHLPLESAIIF